MKISAREHGQALLIVLLIMAVVLTIALSLVSRSVTDVTVTEKEEEAARAYSAAEAGIEKTLLLGTSISSQTLPSGDTFKSNVGSLSSSNREYVVPILMASGETTPVWFVAHDATNQLVCSALQPCFTGSAVKVCWGNAGAEASISATTPALELSIVYTTSDNDFSTARVARIAQDPFVTRPDPNSFTKGSEGICTIDGKNFAFSRTVDFSLLAITIRPEPGSLRRGPQVARLRLVYNTDQAHQVGLAITSASGTFPQQGNKVDATGTSGAASRKIEVYQLFPDLPPIFDYGLFSGSGGITK